MYMNEKPHIVNAALVSFILIAIYIPAITITAEFVPPLKSWLATTYGHHWVGKGIIMMIVYGVLFVALSMIFKAQKKELFGNLVQVSSIMAVLSSLVITVFFIYEYLIH